MDREKAIQILKRCEAESHCGHYKRHYCCIGCGQREALDLAIEALRGDFHCPKCGTIVRDGRQCHDLVYRGEAEVDTSTNTSTDLISRQAAIEEIKNATTITGWNKFASQEEIVDNVERQLRRLFVGAIESLPPVEPKPVCEDAISRADAIKAVEAKIKWFDGDAIEDRYKRYAFIQVLDEILTELPPVESKRPKGEWIFNPTDAIDLMFAKPKCPKCGFESSDGGNFCPNCGADMRGEEDD